MFLAIVVAAVVALGVYFVFSNRMARVQTANDALERQILAAHDRMIAAAESLQVDALFQHVLDAKSAAMVSDGQLIASRDDMLEQTRAGFRGLAALKYDFRQRHVTVFSPTLAVLVASGNRRARTIDGREFSVDFAQTVVLSLEQGAWRVAHTHQSTPR